MFSPGTPTPGRLPRDAYPGMLYLGMRRPESPALRYTTQFFTRREPFGISVHRDTAPYYWIVSRDSTLQQVNTWEAHCVARTTVS